MHDIIGTRCDPYTHDPLNQAANTTLLPIRISPGPLRARRACRSAKLKPLSTSVVNVFMCTGFARDTGQYFMKASPARRGTHPGAFRRDRPAWLHVGLPWRRLFSRAFVRRGCLRPLSVEIDKARADQEAGRRLRSTVMTAPTEFRASSRYNTMRTPHSLGRSATSPAYSDSPIASERSVGLAEASVGRCRPRSSPSTSRAGP